MQASSNKNSSKYNMSYHRPYTACVYQLSVVNLLSFQMQKLKLILDAIIASVSKLHIG